MSPPLVYPHYPGSGTRHLSLLVSLAGHLTSHPNSTSTFKQTNNDNVSFHLLTVLSVPIIQGKIQSPLGVQALLIWFRHMQLYFLILTSPFPPLFCSSIELIVHRIHYTSSFLPLNMCSSLLVHFVSWRAIYLYILRAQKLHICFDPVISFWKIYVLRKYCERKSSYIQIPILAFI